MKQYWYFSQKLLCIFINSYWIFPKSGQMGHRSLIQNPSAGRVGSDCWRVGSGPKKVTRVPLWLNLRRCLNQKILCCRLWTGQPASCVLRQWSFKNQLFQQTFRHQLQHECPWLAMNCVRRSKPSAVAVSLVQKVDHVPKLLAKHWFCNRNSLV